MKVAPSAGWDRVRPTLLVLGALSLELVLLSAYGVHGLTGDDQVNSLVESEAALQGISVVDYITNVVEATWDVSGRFFPLGYYEGYGIFLLGLGPVGYALLLNVLTVVATASTAGVARALGASWAWCALLIVLSGALFQFVDYHDALRAYSGLLQITFALVNLSLTAMVRGLRSGRTGWFWAAGLALAVASLVYEAAYAFVLAHVVAVVFSHQRRVGRYVRALAPVVLVTALFFAVAAVGRRRASEDSGAYAVGLDLVAVLKTFVRQVASTLPGTTLLNDPTGAVRAGGVSVTAVGLLLALAAAVLAFLCLSSVGREADEPDAPSTALGLALGIAVIVSASALISLSPKYQTEVGFGKPYLPYVMQVHGLALGAVFGLRWLHARRRWPVLVTLSAAVAVMVAGHHAANSAVLKAQQPAFATRELAQRALELRALDGLADGDQVLSTDPPTAYTFARPSFVHRSTGRRVTVSPVVPVAGGGIACAVATAGACTPGRAGRWWLSVTPHYALAAKVTSVAGTEVADARTVRLVLPRRDLGRDDLRLLYQPAAPGSPAAAVAVADLMVLRRGAEEVLLALPVEATGALRLPDMHLAPAGP